MKVVCINTNGFYDYCLTIGKIYEVIYIYPNGNYKIINDKDEREWFPKNWFVLLSELRNEKIDKLLKI